MTIRRLTVSVPWQPAYWTTVIGLAMVVLGFLWLVVGWRGTAALLLVPLQVPYVTSGGLSGLAFVGLGAALVNVQVTRHTAARERVLTSLLAQHASLALEAARSGAASEDGGRLHLVVLR